jgi:hypothetical protein
MEIVDAQVRLNMLLPDWQSVDLDVAIAAGLALKWCHAPARLSGEPYPHWDVE